MASSSSDLPFLTPVEEIKKLGHASGSLSRDDLRSLDTGCEVTKEVLRRRIQDIVSDASGFAILSSKSCDGTPIKAERKQHILHTGKKFRTEGRKGVEFLVSNQFVRAFMPDQSTRTAVMMAEAVPLHKGKSAAAILAAAERGWLYMRDFGHRGPLIDHFVWDRAGLTRLEHDSRLWHAARPRPPPPEDMEEETWAKLDFFVVTPCALHDSQNAFRWGHLNQFQDKTLMRDVYISIESLRNSQDIICSSVTDWVGQRLSFAPPRDEAWLADRRQLFEALGVDMEAASILVDDLQLCWEEGRLWVMDGAQVRSLGS